MGQLIISTTEKYQLELTGPPIRDGSSCPGLTGETSRSGTAADLQGTKRTGSALYSVFLNYHEHQYNATPWFWMVVFATEQGVGQ